MALAALWRGGAVALAARWRGGAVALAALWRGSPGGPGGARLANNSLRVDI